VWDDEELMAAHDVSALPGSLDVLWATWGPLRAIVAAAQPNAAHQAIASLGQRFPGAVTVATQNVDGFHQRAGSRVVAELHGSLFQSRCMTCDQSFSDLEVPEGIPLSPCCGAPARPDMVLFGEALPFEASRTAKLACRAADVLLIVGTSGAVSTASGLARYATDYGARTVLVNLEPWGPDSSRWLTATVTGPAEELLPDLVSRLG
jgi:NAD-dependent deacetylase